MSGFSLSLSLLSGFARAGESVCSYTDEVDPPGALVAAWYTDALGDVDGTLVITLPEAEGPVTWEVSTRLHFDAVDATYVDGPFVGDPGSVLSWTISLPADAPEDDRQWDYTSDALVVVRVLVEGVSVAEVSLTPLAVVFDSGGLDPLFLTADLAAEIAPGGAWGDVEPIEEWLTPEEFDARMAAFPVEGDE